MTNIVLIALRRPYTFVVLAILIVLWGIASIIEAPTDVFPNIQMPVSSIVWAYDGLMPQDVEGRITYVFERLLTSTVEGIKYIVSHSYFGFSIVNVFLQEGVDLGGSEADIAAISQTAVKALPPDIASPMVMRLFPSQVPVAVLQVTSETLTPAELYNLSIMRIRPLLVTIPGAILPHPYGGQDMQVMVNLKKDKLLARHLTPADVHKAIAKQNLVLPGGDIKIKSTDWLVLTNASPLTIAEWEEIPIKRVGNAFIHLRDVADVRLAGRVQTNAVFVEGKQAVIIVVMKSSEASTLEVVDGIRAMIPRIEKVVPEDVKIKLLIDASTFVRDAINEVVHEMAMAALLVGLIILLLLGSWRPTLIVWTSIPLSILSALIGLHLLGESINVMTLGGLALAVGILVDNATVMIENIDRHLEMNKSIEEAILDAATQILLPAFVATLAIMIVWIPLFHLSGVAGWVFPSMAEAILLAMAASFILTYTLVPTMAKYLMKTKHHDQASPAQAPTNPFLRFQQGFERRFEQFREAYGRQLERAVAHRRSFVLLSLILAIGSLALYLMNGREFFPEIRSGTLQMHMRAPLGTRIEASGRIATLVTEDIKRLLPGQVENVVSNCGLPVGAHNLAFIPTPTIGPQDCDLTITLHNEYSPVWEYRKILRKGLRELYPGVEFTFQPADLTAKILNFGSLASIDVQVNGPDMALNSEFAEKLAHRFRQIPGTADVVVHQPTRVPTMLVQTDRRFALSTNLTQAAVGNNMLIATAGSQQVDQKYWLDRRTGMSYRINVYVPQPQLTSIKELRTIPVAPEERSASEMSEVELLGNVASISLQGTPGAISHRNIMPVFDVFVSPEGRDLGRVLADVEEAIDELEPEMPKSASVEIHGQAEIMRDAFDELLIGLVAAIVLVYLVLVVNFQSWLDPFIIITALVGALAGIAWSLFLTHTYISVPALTGAIMTMGVGAANAILVIAYARERLRDHGNALQAAIEAGRVRFRPVLMTASAMILGMLPMALGNTQNAPLGRAVIGGLIVATVFTLFFVPCVYVMMYKDRLSRTPFPSA
ncbi:MAG: efflux RND transporter permease subunit [Nitrospirae bacterium]|nr:MAG: efflux RND transporter permease subunit [Nitrospirota bacterium]